MQTSPDNQKTEEEMEERTSANNVEKEKESFLFFFSLSCSWSIVSGSMDELLSQQR